MRAGRRGGWAIVGVCVAYAGFAFATAADGAGGRAAPPLFLVHAVAGGVALIAGAVQLGLGRPVGPGRRRAHRILGRTYVVAAWVTGAGAFGVAVAFDVAPAGRAALASGAALWFAATTVAYRLIRAGRVERHREWAIRSFALAFYFVTFSLWVPLFAATPLPEGVGYPLAVVLSWGLNLAAAEGWIRLARSRRRQAGPAPARR